MLTLIGVLALIAVVIILIFKSSGKTHSSTALELPATAFIKVIEVGGHRNKAAFSDALRKGGFEITPEAQDIMSRPAFTLPQQVQEVEFVFMSLSDMGFPKGATRQSIIQKANTSLACDAVNLRTGPIIVWRMVSSRGLGSA